MTDGVRGFRNVAITLFVVLVSIFCIMQDCFQFDLWQHLACGRHIVETGRLLYTDTYSHTIAGQPFIDQNWLSQVFLYCMYRLGGMPLLTVTVACLYSAAFVFIALCCWNRTRHYLATIICTLLSVALSLENLFLRPQVFSLLFFSLELFVLWNLSDRWKPFATAAIVFLWTNCHGAFVLGILLPAIFMVGEFVKQRWLHHRSSSRRSYLVSMIMAIIASFGNPQPWHTFDYVTQSAANGAALNVREWQPAGVETLTGIVLVGSIIAAFIALKKSRVDIDITDLLLGMIFLFLAFKALRMVVWWGMTLGPLLSIHVAAIIRKDVPARNLRFGSLMLHCTVSILTILIFWPFMKKTNPLRPINEEPAAMIKFLSAGEHPRKVYNALEWGGYLMWHFEGSMKVFIDGRVDPFPPIVCHDYFAISDACQDWEELLDRYGVDTIIASRKRNPRLVAYSQKSKQWKLVYSDPLGVVLERKSDALSVAPSMVSPIVKRTTSIGRSRQAQRDKWQTRAGDCA